jgi:hypothetical protein
MTRQSENIESNVEDARVCTLCGNQAQFIFSNVILHKYTVNYFRCGHCDLIQTDSPYWLEEAYNSTISKLDTGIMARNLVNHQLTKQLCAAFNIQPDTPCLDYGSAQGVFVRLMRDEGIDFKWYDPYSDNLYARGFEGDIHKTYSFITAFEVIEHMYEVEQELNRLLTPHTSLVLVSTLLHQGNARDWWYYSPETGQHVSFYSSITMKYIAVMYGFEAFIGPSYTLFYRKNTLTSKYIKAYVQKILNIPPTWQTALSKIVQKFVENKGAKIISDRLQYYSSLTWSDHLELKSMLTEDEP